MTTAEVIARNELAIEHSAELIDLPVICAWCRQWITPPRTTVYQPSDVSHSICRLCLDVEKRKLELLKTKNT